MALDKSLDFSVLQGSLKMEVVGILASQVCHEIQKGQDVILPQAGFRSSALSRRGGGRVHGFPGVGSHLAATLPVGLWNYTVLIRPELER